MKKVLMAALICIGLLIFPGCDPGMGLFDREELLNQTVEIELVHYDNQNPELIRLGGSETPIFDFSKVTPKGTLDDSLIEDVVEDISEQSLMLFDRALNEPIGKTLILYQSNGNMVVLYSCVYETESGGTKYYDGCSVFDEKGEFVSYLGDISSTLIDTLESKYFGSDAEAN